MFDHRLIASRIQKAGLRAGAARDALDRPNPYFLHLEAAQEIAGRLNAITRAFPRALDIGGFLALSDYPLSGRQGTDFAMMARADTGACGSQNIDIALNDAIIPFGNETLDLAVSILSLQFAQDLPGALVQWRRSLRPDGLFFACLMAEDSLYELRESLLHADIALSGGAAARVIPFAHLNSLGDLLQRAGFALPVVDKQTLHVHYKDLAHLMNDLRALGWSNCLMERLRHMTGGGVFREAETHYKRHYSNDKGRLRATFDLAFLSGWAPHESQQKPLRPGSAEFSLAEALGGNAAGQGNPAGSKPK